MSDEKLTIGFAAFGPAAVGGPVAPVSSDTGYLDKVQRLMAGNAMLKQANTAYALRQVNLEAENCRYKAMCERLADALSELQATVKGECPSLLDEDRGGSYRLASDIYNALSDYRKLKGE